MIRWRGGWGQAFPRRLLWQIPSRQSCLRQLLRNQRSPSPPCPNDILTLTLQPRWPWWAMGTWCTSQQRRALCLQLLTSLTSSRNRPPMGSHHLPSARSQRWSITSSSLAHLILLPRNQTRWCWAFKSLGLVGAKFKSSRVQWAAQERCRRRRRLTLGWERWNPVLLLVKMVTGVQTLVMPTPGPAKQHRVQVEVSAHQACLPISSSQPPARGPISRVPPAKSQHRLPPANRRKQQRTVWGAKVRGEPLGEAARRVIIITSMREDWSSTLMTRISSQRKWLFSFHRHNHRHNCSHYKEYFLGEIKPSRSCPVIVIINPLLSGPSP